MISNSHQGAFNAKRVVTYSVTSICLDITFTDVSVLLSLRPIFPVELRNWCLVCIQLTPSARKCNVVFIEYVSLSGCGCGSGIDGYVSMSSNLSPRCSYCRESYENYNTYHLLQDCLSNP